MSYVEAVAEAKLRTFVQTTSVEWKTIGYWVVSDNNPNDMAYYFRPIRYSDAPHESNEEGGDPSDGDSCPAFEGDPVNISNGNMFQQEVDYVANTTFPLKFSRYYNSQAESEGLWAGWNGDYFQSLEIYRDNFNFWPGIRTLNTVRAHRPDGRIVYFNLDNGIWKGKNYRKGKLVEIQGGWELTTPEDVIETYDTDGRLVSVENKAGLKHTLTYTNQKLTNVGDDYGRQILFFYTPEGLLEKMTDPNGQDYIYNTDSNNNLVSVDYPDGLNREYLYEINGRPNALTGILNNGVRFSTYDYDDTGRAILSEHAGGAEKITVVYNSDGTTKVTDALNADRTYEFQFINSSLKPASISQQACSICSNAHEISYDLNGFVSSKTDWNGKITNYVYDDRGLETSRTEAAGTGEERTILTSWHSTFRLPVQITEPGKTTTFTYDSTGNLLTRTETDTTITPNVSRTTTYTYNSIGQVLTTDGPRTDVNDITTFTYDSMGNRATVTNALNQVTQIPDYDANGNPLTIIDPNGVTTELTYDVRQRLTGRTVAADTVDEATTAFTYDAVGQLTRITKPDGSYLDYEYDDAHRLAAIQDNLGNRIEYTLDAAGNHTAENIYDPGSVLRKTRTAVYDQLSRLTQSIGAGTQTVTYGYDDNGNQTSVTDGNSNTTTQGFDALNRLTQMIDPYNGAASPTSYAYDAQDNLTGVTDPTGFTTTYQYNGFREVIQETSPNTGATTYTYDSAGNRTGKTDARGVTVVYSYDALNRLTGVDYPGTEEDISYTYDQTLNNNPGIGRLTQIQDQSGSTGYRYDRRGNIIQVDQTVVINSQNVPLSTAYQYDPADNLVRITYPSGRVVDYNRNSLGQVDQVSATYNMQPQTLAGAIGYLPFGSLNSITYGNGLTRTLAHDQDYRVTDIVTPGLQDLNFSYDLNNNITQLLNAIDVSADQSFGYDGLDRLTTATGTYGDQIYSYDGIGNRLSLTADGNITNYGYFSSTHRLQSVGSQTRAYDNAGNTTQIDNDTYSYNNQNRLSQATANGQTVDYVYNSLGQRTIRQTAADTTLSIFDQNGLLIGEYDDTGSLIREYVYLNGEPLALSDTTASYFYLNDHLGTPQLLMDQNQQVVWQADYSPFGEANITTASVENNLRFPGQYFDAETGFHYNWFRYYDPNNGGRYISNDPIGISGGLNTYLYANANPIRFIDSLGLYCVWIQATGKYACYANNSADPYIEGKSYAGKGPCVNGTHCERVADWGPLPRGCYRVEGKPGDLRRNLTPLPSTNMHNRDHMQIHGDNPRKPPQSSSEGCAIINKGDRNKIPEGEIFCVL